jgi:hypothetical protein
MVNFVRQYVKRVRELNALLPNSEEPFARASKWAESPHISGWPDAAIEVRLDPGHRMFAYLLNDRWCSFLLDSHPPESVMQQHGGPLEIYGSQSSELGPKDSPVSWILDRVRSFYSDYLSGERPGINPMDEMWARMQLERIDEVRSRG